MLVFWVLVFWFLPSGQSKILRAGSIGNYYAVVTGPGGSVASQVATLTVVTSPLVYQAETSDRREIWWLVPRSSQELD
jgi:hypothetical protein